MENGILLDEDLTLSDSQESRNDNSVGLQNDLVSGQEANLENREDHRQEENQILSHKHQNLASFGQENKIPNNRKRRIMDFIDSSFDETDSDEDDSDEDDSDEDDSDEDDSDEDDSDEDFAPTDLPQDTQNLVYYYQSIEVTSCIGKPTRPIDPEILQNGYRRIDRAIAQVHELFPELNLDDFLKNQSRKRKKCQNLDCPCMNEALIISVLSGHILDNKDKFKKREAKKMGDQIETKKRKVEAPPKENLIYELEAEVPRNALSLDKISEFFRLIESEFIKAINTNENRLKCDYRCECYHFFQESFISLRFTVFNMLDAVLKSTHAGHNFLAVSIVCFIIENKFIQRSEFETLRAAFINDELEIDWNNMQNPRQLIDLRKAKPKNYSSPDLFYEPAKKYTEFLGLLQQKFPEMFDSEGKFNKIIIDEFLKNPARFQEDGLTFSCGVCFEEFLLKYGVQCEPKDGVYQLDPNQPSGSKTAPAPIIHTFCRPCIRGHAKATTGEISLAEGCVGLRCMESGCKNAIFISSIRDYIPNDILTRLDERIQEEILGLVQIKHLERCPKCNFAIDMGVSAKINKVFRCLQCQCEFCRLCEEPWEHHFGFSCKEFKGKEKNRINKEEKLSRKIIRYCPQCKLRFFKDGGCDWMTCRCGHTFRYSHSK